MTALFTFSRYGVRLGLLLLTLILMTGCVTVDVSESKVFLPYSSLTQQQKQNVVLGNHFALTPKNVTQEHFTRQASFGNVAMSHMSLVENAAKPIVLACMGTSADRYRSGRYYTQKSIDYGDVILFDYPGYNDSDGTPTTDNFIEAAKVVSGYLRELRNETNRPIIAAGHSLGGFVCSEMVAQNPDLFDGIIIETSAQNIDHVVKARTPALIGFLLKPRVTASLRKFDVADSLQGFEGPVLVLGGEQDKVLKVDLTHRLHGSLVAQGNDVDLHIFEEAGHEDVYKHPDYPSVMQAFYSQF